MELKVPEKVVQTFRDWMGIEVCKSEIHCFPDNGYRDNKHGGFDLYVLRRDGILHKVRACEDGNVEYL